MNKGKKAFPCVPSKRTARLFGKPNKNIKSNYTGVLVDTENGALHSRNDARKAVNVIKVDCEKIINGIKEGFK